MGVTTTRSFDSKKPGCEPLGDKMGAASDKMTKKSRQSTGVVLEERTRSRTPKRRATAGENRRKKASGASCASDAPPGTPARPEKSEQSTCRKFCVGKTARVLFAAPRRLVFWERPN